MARPSEHSRLGTWRVFRVEQACFADTREPVRTGLLLTYSRIGSSTRLPSDVRVALRYRQRSHVEDDWDTARTSLRSSCARQPAAGRTRTARAADQSLRELRLGGPVGAPQGIVEVAACAERVGQPTGFGGIATSLWEEQHVVEHSHLLEVTPKVRDRHRIVPGGDAVAGQEPCEVLGDEFTNPIPRPDLGKERDT